MALLGTISKQPGERVPVNMSYVQALAGRDGTVTDMQVVGATGILIDGVLFSGTSGIFYVSEGTDGQNYSIQITATLTVAGENELVEDEILVLVDEISVSGGVSPWIGGMVSLENALSRVLTEIPHVDDTVALRALSDAAVMFCQKTCAWSMELDPVTSTTDKNTYIIPVPRNAAIVKLQEYSINGDDADVVHLKYGATARRNDRAIDIAWSADSVTFSVHPTPAVDTDEYTLRVAVKPRVNSTTIPSEIYEQHIIEIAKGAVAELLDQSDKPWTNVTRAERLRNGYFDYMRIQASRVSKGYSSRATRVRPRFF